MSNQKTIKISDEADRIADELAQRFEVSKAKLIDTLLRDARSMTELKIMARSKEAGEGHDTRAAKAARGSALHLGATAGRRSR